MATTQRRFFSGNSLEQAVLAAARHYALEPEHVAYTIRDKQHGFLNVRRKFVIEVDPGEPRRPPGEEVPWEPKLAGRPDRAPAPAPAPDKRESRSPKPPSRGPRPETARQESRPPESRPEKPRPEKARADKPRPDKPRPDKPRPEPAATGPGESSARDAGPAGKRPPREHRHPRPERPAPEPVTADPLEAADLALGELAELLLFDLQWEIRLDEEETLHVELDGDDSDRLIAEDGKILRSMEHLLPRLLRSKLGRGLVASLDCNGFRADHEASLQAFARRTAEEVRKTRKPRLLDPMTPADRRLIHIALANDPTVETRSEGDGFTKRVKILPN